jgi:hypothetical protein
MVAHAIAMASPGDPIYVCNGNDLVARYYLQVRYPPKNNPIVERTTDPEPRAYLDQADTMVEKYRKAWVLTYASCGDMSPLIEHLTKSWTVDLVEKDYPDGRLYIVH